MRYHSIAARVATALALLLSLLPSTAGAEPITFSFTGEINFVSADLVGTFAVGETVTGVYTFESTAAPTGGLPWLALYNTTITSYQATTSGGYSASATNGQIAVWNNDPDPFGRDDTYRAVAASVDGFDLIGADVNGVPLIDFVVRLHDPTSTAFGNTDLPLTIDLSDFDLTSPSSLMQFFFATDVDEQSTFRFVNATIESVAITPTDPTPVPEPGTLTLIASGLLLGYARFRRRSHSTRS